MSSFRSFLAEPVNGGLIRSIESVLANAPERILLSDEVCSLTGADIQARIQEFKALFDMNIPEGARVGVFLPNSTAKALTILALMALRRIPVLLNVADHDLRLEERIKKMHLQALIIEHSALDRTPESVFKIGLDSQSRVGGIRKPDQIRELCPVPAGTVLILYTSGSMGEPKGVCLSESAILYNVDFLIRYQGLDETTVATMVLPICHTMALNTQFLPAFFSGGKSIFYDVTLSLGRIYRSLLDSQGTSVALISHLVRLCHDEKLRKGLPPAWHVKQVTLAGGVIRSHHLEMCEELFPNATIYKGYGLTEAIRVSMISHRDPNFFENTAGYVLPKQEVEIRDDEGNVLPRGEVGQIFVRGPNVMLGYDQTDSAKNESPFEKGFLRTNDMGAFSEEGHLLIQGRSDGVVKILGKKISLKNIEDAALHALPRASDVKCIAIPSERSDQSLVLFVELPDAVLGLDESRLFELETELRVRVKHLCSLPKDVIFLRSFPRTPNAKIKVAALRDLFHRRHMLNRLVTADLHRISFYGDSLEGQVQHGPLDPFGMGDVK